MNQQTAQGLASLGRGPDSMLVHMAPGEVKSLQQLAMAHGGSLTINPETGLPEAGFLSSLLPMLIGGGLTIASGGALSPVMAGLLTGGGVGLATGSLKKGLMAGFGAYGGAGLGSALAGAGGANLAAAGGVNAANLAGPAVPSIEAFNPSNLAGSSSPGMFGNAAANFSKAGAGITGLGSEAGRNAFMSQIGGAKGLGMAGLAAASPMLMETTTKQPEIKTDKDMGQRYRFNAGTQTPTPTPDVPEYGNQGLNFGKERRYFNPVYTPIDNTAARKMLGFASGGPVEDMSNANAIGMNTGYPQADIRTGAYATPYQQPISRDMIQPQFAGGGSINLQGTFDMGGGQGGGASSPAQQTQPFVGSNNAPSMTLPAVMPQNQLFRGTPEPAVMPRGLQGLLKGPMSQGMAFAEGGAVDSYTYDPVTQMYVKKSGEGATMVSPTGGISGASAGGVDAVPSDWDNMTPAEKAGFFQDPANATHAGLRNLAQQLYGYTTLGMVQNFLDPSRQFAEAAITRGQTPQQTFRGLELGANPATEQAAAEAAAEAATIANDIDAISASEGITSGGGGGGGSFGDSVSDNSDSVGRAKGGLAALAQGGISHLGDYSDGGRLLRGPGDGISDSIPAMIGKKRPARLADGEFVVPARIVSELGNGSTEAGARKLYAMMDRVQKARKKTVGKGKVAANSRSAKYLPA